MAATCFGAFLRNTTETPPYLRQFCGRINNSLPFLGSVSSQNSIAAARYGSQRVASFFGGSIRYTLPSSLTVTGSSRHRYWLLPAF